MSIETPSPYQPPAPLNDGKNPAVIQSSRPTTKSTKLGKLAMALAATGLLMPVLIVGLATYDIIHVRWDSSLLPSITLFGCLPLSIVSLVMSIIAFVQRRSRMPVFGIVVSTFAILGSLAATVILAVMAAAGHPV